MNRIETLNAVALQLFEAGGKTLFIFEQPKFPRLLSHKALPAGAKKFDHERVHVDDLFCLRVNDQNPVLGALKEAAVAHFGGAQGLLSLPPVRNVLDRQEHVLLFSLAVAKLAAIEEQSAAAKRSEVLGDFDLAEPPVARDTFFDQLANHGYIPGPIGQFI